MFSPNASSRLPANHQLIYDVVRAMKPGHHAAVGDIFARARELKASLGYSTVYRALDRLCRMGLVLEVHVPGTNAALYEQARSGHAHFVCRTCGRIEDVECDVPTGPLRATIEARGGEVHEVTFTVNGHCAACRTSNRGGLSEDSSASDFD